MVYLAKDNYPVLLATQWPSIPPTIDIKVSPPWKEGKPQTPMGPSHVDARSDHRAISPTSSYCCCQYSLLPLISWFPPQARKWRGEPLSHPVLVWC